MKKSSRPPLPPPIQPFGQNRFEHENCNWTEITDTFLRVFQRFRRKEKIQQSDTSKVIIERRKKTTIDYIDKIIDHYKDIPGLDRSQTWEIGFLWIALNFSPFSSYNSIEESSYILFAASIWILDQISATPGWKQKLYPLLPSDPDVLDDLVGPDAWDAAYENDLILSVMSILYYRDIDIAPMERAENGTDHVLTSSLNANGGQHADVGSRRSYEELIRLIPDEAMKLAAKHFEDLLWAWTDRLFTCIAPLNAACCDMVDTIDRAGDRCNQMRQELLDLMAEADNEKKRQRQQKKQKKSLSPFMMSNATGLDDLLRMSDPLLSGFGSRTASSTLIEHDDPIQKALDLADTFMSALQDYQKLVETHQELESKETLFITDMVRCGFLGRAQCESEYGKDVAAKMQPLPISNPYEICFALLWMIESGSDLPWLFGPGCGMIQEVVENLPWGIIEYNAFDDPVWPPEDEEFDEQDTLADWKEPFQSTQKSPIPDWYERKYVPKDKDEAFAFNRSMAQIVYEETGCLMPRDMYKYEELPRRIRRYGVTGKEPIALTYVCAALSQAKRQRRAENLDNLDESLAEADATADQAEQKLSYDELAEQLKQSREENKRLRSTMHDYERSARDLKKEMSSVRETANLEHRELADLRELVFNQRSGSGQEQTEEEPDNHVFPYEVGQNTIVFGGHETWLKAIRTMLTGNIRFVDKDLINFDPGIIRTADKLWIQPNAMSHTQYYRIVDAARQHKKPVRYFTYSSAAKSAMQIVDEDQ